MSKKSVEIYTDSSAGKGFAPKGADKSKTATVAVKNPLLKICEAFTENKTADAVKRIGKLPESEKEVLKAFAILIFRETGVQLSETVAPQSLSDCQE